MEPEDESKNWRQEAEYFITRWEIETEQIKEKELDPEQCCQISDTFHRDTEGLLVKKPATPVHHDILVRLDQLENTLNTTLAMVCTCSKEIKK
ncbi:MAG: hypothetical protein QXL17_06995 [Candidatus Thermoplasmatota archaeon]